MRLPVLEMVAAFAGANLVFARFEKVARVSVIRGVMRGLYDLGDRTEQGRLRALVDVPREVRLRIEREIDAGLGTVGLTRSEVARNVRDLQALRELRSTVIDLRRLA